MKIKLLLPCLLISAASTNAMREELTAENIETHPKFLVIKQLFNDINAEIKILPDRISISQDLAVLVPGGFAYKAGHQEAIYFSQNDFWDTIARVRSHFYTNKEHFDLHRSAHTSLKGLCIFMLEDRCRDGEQEALAQVEQLPECLKLQFELLRKYGILCPKRVESLKNNNE